MMRLPIDAARAALCCALMLVAPVAYQPGGGRQGDRRLARRPGAAVGDSCRARDSLPPRASTSSSTSEAARPYPAAHRRLARRGAERRHHRPDPRHREGRADRDHPHRRQRRALCADRQEGAEIDQGPQGQDHLGRRGERHHHCLFRTHDGRERVQEGRLRDHLGGSRGRPLRGAQGRRRRRRAGAAAAQLPGRDRGLRHAWYRRGLRQGRAVHRMAVHRRWAQGANGAVVKRILAATDKSVAWLADTSHRAEAIELLVRVARSRKEDAE